MSDKDTIKSVFDKYRRSDKADTPTEATIHDLHRKKPYIAAEINRSGERVRRLRG